MYAYVCVDSFTVRVGVRSSFRAVIMCRCSSVCVCVCVCMCGYTSLCVLRASARACTGVVCHNDKYDRNPDDNPELNPDTNPEIVALTHTLSVTLTPACKVTDRAIAKETVIVRALVPAVLCVPARM